MADPLGWLPLVLALPLAGVLVGVFVRRLPDRLFARLATVLVGATFLVSALVLLPGLESLRPGGTAIAGEIEAGDGHEGGPVYRQVLWRWISVDAESAVRSAPETDGMARPPSTPAMVVDAELQLDGLSLVMLLLVSGVGFLIHLFSLGYMAQDAGIRRYFIYLNLFVFSMLTLVLGANFLVLFVGWELVGACSYLLIGFWYADSANADAGRKAFIVNRVGDFAFLIGLVLIWLAYGSISFADVLSAEGPSAALLGQLPAGGALGSMLALLPTLICLCLLVGATGKSAQLPLFVWLPDAMAGPTPVSALIHAATMVTAGIYMIARVHALFELAPGVLNLVAVVGGLTALVAACIAVVQVDIKRTLAYSTVSQLGYMFLGLGAGAYLAAVFHLVTHAFFKALLFLGAGSVMHAVEHGFHHEHAHPAPKDGVPAQQDMRNMGGLLGRLPVTGWTFLVGGLALAGMAPLAGFWSKDEILHAVLGRASEVGGGGLFLALWVMGLLTAFLTAFYTGRQLLLVLGGQPRSVGAEHAVESPSSMTVPLIVLGVLATLGGFLGPSLPGWQAPLARLLGPVLGEHEAVTMLGKLAAALVALGVALAGLGLAWLTYGPKRRIDPTAMGERFRGLYRLAAGKFFLDEIYMALFVRPFRRLADWLWQFVDDRVIDGALNAAGRSIGGVGQAIRQTQSGYVRRYALSLVVGLVLLAAVLVLVK